MRVAHLLRKYNPAEWGGTETAIQLLLDGLREQDVQNVVYCPRIDVNGAPDPLHDAGHRVERFNAFVPVLGISRRQRSQMISVGGNLMSLDLLVSLWREPDLSIIHTHTLGRLGGIALTIAEKKQIPLVVSIHGGAFDMPSGLKKSLDDGGARGLEWGRIFGLLLRSHSIFQSADAIIAVNPNEAALVQKKFPDRRVVVQPHGIPISVYETDHRIHAQNAFPQLRGKKVLLCVGRIDPVKNSQWLVEQAPAMLERHPDALLVFAGACTHEEYGAQMRRVIQQLGLESRILLTGGLPPRDPRLLGLLQLADVVLLPSVSETFGLVILEAWAAGTTVISSRTSGASALVDDGENGWLFDLEKPGTFHCALDAALTQPELRRGFAARGRQLVAGDYSDTALAGRMKSLYEELIEEKHAHCHHS